MPQALVAITGFFTGVGALAAGAIGLTVGPIAALAIGVTTVVGTAVYLRRVHKALNADEVGGSQSLGIAIRATDAFRTGVYGEALVGGVVTYANVSGTENRELYYEVVHTAHEISAFVGWKIDDRTVYIADVDDINASPSGDGSIDADTNSHGLGPVAGDVTAYLRGHLGDPAQLVDSMLESTFADIGVSPATHRHRGCARTVGRFDLLPGGEAVWDGKAPTAPVAIVQGKLVYDPRQDGTLGYSPDGGHRVNDSSTWEYSDNPALCWADYLIDDDLGVGISSSRIDYASVATAADICDTLVDIPPVASPQTQEKRYRISLVWDTGMEHQQIVQRILDTMGGRMVYYRGQFRVYAAQWDASSLSLDEDDLIGDYVWQKQPSTQRGDRFNQVRGTYIDPLRDYTVNQFITWDDTTLRTNRDNSRVLPVDLDLPGVSSEYQSQRIANLTLAQADDTGILEFPIGYQGANVRVGDVVDVTLDDLDFSAKTFRVMAVRYIDFQGVSLTLKEDESGNFQDPAVGDYGTKTAEGVITTSRFRRNMVGGGVVGDTLLADPFFLRMRAFVEQVVSYDPSAFWIWNDAGGNHTASFVDGGVGAAVRVNISTDTSGGGLYSNTVGEPLFFNGEDFRINMKIRRISGSPTSGTAFIGVNLYDSDRVTGESQDFSTLAATTVAGWTVNEWQYLEYTATISSSSTSRVYIAPYIFFGSFLQPFDAATVIEIDMFNITRI